MKISDLFESMKPGKQRGTGDFDQNDKKSGYRPRKKLNVTTKLSKKSTTADKKKFRDWLDKDDMFGDKKQK